MQKSSEFTNNRGKTILSDNSGIFIISMIACKFSADYIQMHMITTLFFDAIYCTYPAKQTNSLHWSRQNRI